MSKIVKANQPCPSCGSSDARQVYADGSYCFSCNKYFKAGELDDGVTQSAPAPTVSDFGKPPVPRIGITAQTSRSSLPTLAEIAECRPGPILERGISKETATFYNTRLQFNSQGMVSGHFYDYAEDHWKLRTLPKDFVWINSSPNLFGADKFPGGGKRLIIVEGEIDTMVMAEVSFQRYDRFYPIVGLSSASIVEKSLLHHRDWIRSFKEVVLCFDADEAGRDAMQKAIKIVGLDKALLVYLPEKDPDLVNKKHGPQILMQCVFDASPYIPSGIITKNTLWTQLAEYNDIPSIPYAPCFEGLNEKLLGARYGEIALFVAGTGSGKSTIMRENLLHFLKIVDHKIGVIELEAAPAETARKLAGMELRRNPALEKIPLEELKVGFDTVFGDDRIILLDHQGSMKDDSILEKIEYMCLTGCRMIMLDHITILVSEGAGELTGNEAQDKVMNDLLRIAKRHNVWIGLVSHLRKTPNNMKSFEEGKLPSLDDIRGSGSIKQVSFDIIAAARNLQAKEERVRNTIKMAVLKARYTGLTGRVAGAIYNHETGRLRAQEGFEAVTDDDEEFTSV